jgi:hypothetical protein
MASLGKTLENNFSFSTTCIHRMLTAEFVGTIGYRRNEQSEKGGESTRIDQVSGFLKDKKEIEKGE